MRVMSLDEVVRDLAFGIKAVDDQHPVAVNQRTGASYQPGIGPHTEALTTKLVVETLATRIERWNDYRLGVPYGNGSRQACDLCLGTDPWDWAVEVKMLRLMGDNGKTNDNILMHILSPYPAQRSALTDCEKLVDVDLGKRRAVVIYGYDYPAWPMDPVIEAFEVLARQRVKLGDRAVADFDGLIHPVVRPPVVWSTCCVSARDFVSAHGGG